MRKGFSQLYVCGVKKITIINPFISPAILFARCLPCTHTNLLSGSTAEAGSFTLTVFLAEDTATFVNHPCPQAAQGRHGWGINLSCGDTEEVPYPSFPQSNSTAFASNFTDVVLSTITFVQDPGNVALFSHHSGQDFRDCSQDPEEKTSYPAGLALNFTNLASDFTNLASDFGNVASDLRNLTPKTPKILLI